MMSEAIALGDHALDEIPLTTRNGHLTRRTEGLKKLPEAATL